MNPPNTKYVVAFDIDDTMCKNMWKKDGDMDAINEIKLLHHDAPTAQWGDYHYFCAPHFGTLFHYLINNDVRIVFFSAGLENRNINLIEKILPQYLNSSSYQDLKKIGQFKIFSSHHTTDEFERERMKGEGRRIKDLHKILDKDETIENAIIIEDDRSFIKYDQWPCIMTLDLSNWDLDHDNNHPRSFPKNAAYYLIGIFKEYFEQSQYRNLGLKAGITKIYKDHDIEDIKEYYIEPESLLTKKMIQQGLNHMKLENQITVVYGDYDHYDHSGKNTRTGEDEDLNTYVRKTLNKEAYLHLEKLKHDDRIIESPSLDKRIMQDIVTNNIPDPTNDLIEKAADILGNTDNQDEVSL